MRGSDIERRIRKELTPAAYAQLVKDLNAARRAFTRMEEVAPELLRELVRAVNRRHGTLRSAHEAVDELILELRARKHDYVRVRAIRLVKK